MKITYLGHSCFKIESKNYSIVTDPYEPGSVPGYKPLSVAADKAIASHSHGDHSAVDQVMMTLEYKAEPSPFTITQIETYHDEVQGEKRGPNTISIIDDGEFKVAHMGDLGCELTAEQKEMLKLLDCIMIPVGGFYTIDGKEAAKLIKEIDPRIVIPMHFRNEEKKYGYDVIDTVDTFVKAMGNAVFTETSSIELDTYFPCQTVVLEPLNREIEYGLNGL